MRERPIEFSSPGVDRAEGKSAIADASHGNHFGIVPARENLLRFFEILVGESFLDDTHAILLQQPDYSLPGDARPKSSIWNGREHHAIFRHENIRGGKFGNVA